MEAEPVQNRTAAILPALVKLLYEQHFATQFHPFHLPPADTSVNTRGFRCTFAVFGMVDVNISISVISKSAHNGKLWH